MRETCRRARFAGVAPQGRLWCCRVKYLALNFSLIASHGHAAACSIAALTLEPNYPRRLHMQHGKDGSTALDSAPNHSWPPCLPAPACVSS